MTRHVTPVMQRLGFNDERLKAKRQRFGDGVVLATVFDFRRRMKWQSWLLLVGVGLAVYFGYHAVNGSRGLFASEQKQEELEVLERRLAVLRDERTELERRVHRLRPGSLDPELIDELARETLSMVEAEDVIILLEPEISPSDIGDR